MVGRTNFQMQQRWCGGGRGRACSLFENLLDGIQDVFGGHPCFALCSACLLIGIATLCIMLATSTCDTKKLTPLVAGVNEGSDEKLGEGYKNYHDGALVLLRSTYLSVSVPRIPVASALVANIRAKKMESSFILEIMMILSWWKCNN